MDRWQRIHDRIQRNPKTVKITTAFDRLEELFPPVHAHQLMNAAEVANHAGISAWLRVRRLVRMLPRRARWPDK
jgi:predicted DsbA family dithiol-disulfide isomerase